MLLKYFVKLFDYTSYNFDIIYNDESLGFYKIGEIPQKLLDNFTVSKAIFSDNKLKRIYVDFDVLGFLDFH